MFYYITLSASCCKLSDDLLTWHAVFTYKVIFVETFLELLNPRLESIVYVCDIITRGYWSYNFEPPGHLGWGY